MKKSNKIWLTVLLIVVGVAGTLLVVNSMGFHLFAVVGPGELMTFCSEDDWYKTEDNFQGTANDLTTFLGSHCTGTYWKDGCDLSYRGSTVVASDYNGVAIFECVTACKNANGVVTGGLVLYSLVYNIENGMLAGPYCPTADWCMIDVGCYDYPTASCCYNSEFTNPYDPYVPNATACVPDWECTAWSSCANEIHTRICTDTNDCGVNTGKPVLFEACTVVCQTDTKACSDGSYVARVAPSCEFAPCPTLECENGDVQTATCPDGELYNIKTCVNNKWVDVKYFADPCLQPIGNNNTYVLYVLLIILCGFVGGYLLIRRGK
jgi:hypothetical protein